MQGLEKILTGKGKTKDCLMDLFSEHVFLLHILQLEYNTSIQS